MMWALLQNRPLLTPHIATTSAEQWKAFYPVTKHHYKNKSSWQRTPPGPTDSWLQSDGKGLAPLL